uniref:non-specific serine/threonine protein kinase n=1 Tax=Panagrellus redivivus TaxID=6233 RepID=A0A7E4VEK5_PANRE
MMAARKGPSAEGSAENNSNVSAHFSSEHAPKKSPNHRSPLSAENTKSKSNSTGNAKRRAKSLGHRKRNKATLGSQENDKRPSAENLKSIVMQPKVKKKYGRKGTPLLQPKARLQDNYVIEAMIGGGGFGQVYRAFHEVKGIHVAVKVEPKDHEPGRMILEQSILTELRGFPNAPTLYGSGSVDNINFIIMEILGANLSDLRKKQPDQRLSVGSGMRCILQGCTALRTLHGIGYIHRDVKPSNFCIGEKGFQRRIVYLVDFGLSRKYRDKHGNLRRQRRVAEFRGTLKYVSVNVHRKKDQGPVDDFISLYYSAVEITEGNLPWRMQRDQKVVEKAKLDFRLDEYVKFQTLAMFVSAVLRHFGAVELQGRVELRFNSGNYQGFTAIRYHRCQSLRLGSDRFCKCFMTLGFQTFEFLFVDEMHKKRGMDAIVLNVAQCYDDSRL